MKAGQPVRFAGTPTAGMELDAFDAIAKGFGIRQENWFTLDVIAENKVIRTLVDGQAAATFDDSKGALPPGRIALFCRGEGGIHVESIEVKEPGPWSPPASRFRLTPVAQTISLRCHSRSPGGGSA